MKKHRAPRKRTRRSSNEAVRPPTAPPAPPRPAPARAAPNAAARSVPGFVPTGGSVPRLGPIVIGPRLVDPTQEERIKRALGAAAPLLLLPLRIEYRVLQVATLIHVTAGVASLFRDAQVATV